MQLSYCDNNAAFTIAFLSEKGKLFEMESALCEAFPLWLLPEVKDLKWIVNLHISWVKAFTILDDMFSLYHDTGKPKGVGFLGIFKIQFIRK